VNLEASETLSNPQKSRNPLEYFRKMMRREVVFVIIKFILAINKNICQRKLFIWYHINITPF